MTGVLDLLRDGKKHEITETDYAHFRAVLPPVTGEMIYQGEKWDFGFAKGAAPIRLFKHEGRQYFAVETPYLNPIEAGGIPLQKTRWIKKWVDIGKKNPWIRKADDPPFNTQSFCECQTDHELLERFKNANWSLGQAFFVGNLCFIQQVNAGDEWLTIKDGTPFESISFGLIIKEDGMAEAQKTIDDIRAATIEQCKKLDYRHR